LKQRQKICLNLLIKKKRIAQLINGKPDKNCYNKITREQHLRTATSKPTKYSQPTTKNSQHLEHHDTKKIHITENLKRAHHSRSCRRFLYNAFLPSSAPYGYLSERLLHYPDHVLGSLPYQNAGNVFAMSRDSRLQTSKQAAKLFTKKGLTAMRQHFSTDLRGGLLR
jgi:hypothetical protein